MALGAFLGLFVVLWDPMGVLVGTFGAIVGLFDALVGEWAYLRVQVGALVDPSGALTWDPLQCSQAAGHTLSHSALPSAHTDQEQCTTA